MLVEVSRLVLVVLLLFALPGYLVVNAAFPRRTFRGLERGYLVLATGALALMAVGVALGLLPRGGERGWFTTSATGFPSVELATAAACVALFWVGLVRGAYPKLAARYPRLLVPEARGLVGR